MKMTRAHRGHALLLAAVLFTAGLFAAAPDAPAEPVTPPAQAPTTAVAPARESPKVTGAAQPRAATAPTFDDLSSTVTIPEVAGVEFLIDGVLVTAGPHSFTVPYGAQWVEVTARGVNGAPAPVPGKWRHRFPEVVQVTPPRFEDGMLRMSVPNHRGVITYLGDRRLNAGSWVDMTEYAGKEVTVRSVAASVLTVLKGPSEWTHTFPARSDLSLENGDEFEGQHLSKEWNAYESTPTSQHKSVYRWENISLHDGLLDIRISRHCLKSQDEVVSDANRNEGVCPAGQITRYSSARIDTDFRYGVPKSMEVRAKLDAEHHGITATAWMHNEQPFCNGGVTNTNLAEFDVMEVWATEYSTSFSHITCQDSKYHTNGVRTDQHIPGAFHTWRVEWDGEALRYYFDGAPLLGPQGHAVTAQSLGLSREKFIAAISDYAWRLVIGVKLPINGSWAPWVPDDQPFKDRHDLYDYIRFSELKPEECAPGGEIGKLWSTHPELGKQTGCETDSTVPGARRQVFENGRIYWSPATGAQIITGAIEDRFLAAGEEQNLGLPLAGELTGLRDGGASQRFDKATIFFSPATGAHFARGEILKRYAAMGWETGAFGYPTTDEACGIRDGGCYQRFQHENGHIYWTGPTGAHSIQGQILARYGAMGYENSAIGYPTSDEICGLVGGGCHNRFQRENGHLYWSPATGAWGVQGAIYAHYANNGWEWGRLGYPTGGEQCRNLPGQMECNQNFQRGKVIWNSRTGARG